MGLFLFQSKGTLCLIRILKAYLLTIPCFWSSVENGVCSIEELIGNVISFCCLHIT